MSGPYLDDFLGLPRILVDDTELVLARRRAKLNLIAGAGVAIVGVDNPTTESVDLTITAAEDADAVSLRGKPLAAGVGTAGVGQDGYVLSWDNATGEYVLVAAGSASLPSGVGGQVLVRNVGTGDPEFAELLDANIAAGAAIAGTKIAPNFGAQNIVTTGYLASGASPADAGAYRIGHAQSFRGRNQANDANRFLFAWGVDGVNVLGVGDTGNGGTVYGAGDSGALPGHHFFVGATEYFEVGVGFAVLGTGTTPSTGTLRLPYQSTVYAVDSVGADARLFGFGVAIDTLTLGDAGYATQILGTAVTIEGAYLALGATVASAGTMRVGETFTLNGLAGAANRPILALSAGNVYFGNADSEFVTYDTSDWHVFNVASEEVLSLSATRATVYGQFTYDCIQSFGSGSTPITTTDATVTTLATLAPGNNKAGRVSVVVTARQATTQVVNVYSIQQSYETDGSGNVTLRGTATVVAEDEDDADWACVLDASTTSIRVRVTGEAATTIDWRCAGQAMVA